MRVRVRGTNLPGSRFDDGGASGCVYEDVMVGVQRGREVEQLAPGDSATVTFELELRPTGDRDARGPHAQGRPGGRFVYLAWVAGADREMFRRAKLMLADVPPDLWCAAQGDDRVLEATLSLSDACGAPLCARVAPDAITWSVVDDRPR